MKTTIKHPPNATETRALRAADRAANSEHDDILDATRSTATTHVYDSVVEAAERAYRAAGGQRDLVVRGRGNTTHPVISVVVGIARLTGGAS